MRAALRYRNVKVRFYIEIQPSLAASLKLHDTCGVNNLHGIPAVMAALVSVVVSFMNETPYVIDDTQVPWLKQLYCLLCTLGVAIISGSGKVYT